MTLHTDHLSSLEQIERFLNGTIEIDFHAPDRAARRAWIERVLRQFRYAQRSRRERGLLLRFLTKVTGYSPAQMKRLLKQFRIERHLRDRRGPPAKPFAYRYTVADQQALQLACARVGGGQAVELGLDLLPFGQRVEQQDVSRIDGHDEVVAAALEQALAITRGHGEPALGIKRDVRDPAEHIAPKWFPTFSHSSTL